MMSSGNNISRMATGVAFLTLVFAIVCLASVAQLAQGARVHQVNRRSTPAHSTDQGHKSMLHNHMSRKVFERACAASKDTLEEIIACLTGNEHLMKAVKKEDALSCHKEAFGIEFDPKDAMKHKELVCKNREKFEQMTACIYRKTAEATDAKEIEKLTEAMVDVGLCIINALDG